MKCMDVKKNIFEIFCMYVCMYEVTCISKIRMFACMMNVYMDFSQQSMEPYRKHKAATHRLQLNKGFKYTKKMNLSTDSLY